MRRFLQMLLAVLFCTTAMCITDVNAATTTNNSNEIKTINIATSQSSVRDIQSTAINSEANAYSHEEVYLTAQLIHHEAHNQPYDGKVAIAEVVLNRVRSKIFPNSIDDVIFQTGQFTSVRRIRNISPTEQEVRIADRVLNGKLRVFNDSGILYFRNPKVTSGLDAETDKDWGSLDYVTCIGDHAFYSQMLFNKALANSSTAKFDSIRSSNEIEGIRRLRFTTSNPIKFNQEIINAFADIPKIANSLHLPVQSGSDRILKLMGRPYTSDDYRDMIAKIKLVRPTISISSDFIVGFPNESDQDFNDTMKLIEDIRFDNSFSFIYSKRPHTPAATMEDNISLEVKKSRLSELQARINNYAMQYSREMLNTTQPVLIEGISQYGDMLCGKTENNRTVNFIGDKSLIGQMADVKIIDVLPHSLKGELISII